MGEGLAISPMSPPVSLISLSSVVPPKLALPMSFSMKYVQTMLWVESGVQTLLLGLSGLSPSGLLIPMYTNSSKGWDSGSVVEHHSGMKPLAASPVSNKRKKASEREYLRPICQSAAVRHRG